ncbi:hypothetical protein [Absidia glauca]|uniref:Uncharacterized protein n=1 Tax=Absidia glauca TaxID=4829 RepID=A0A163JS56_ABSGL|nr:hypothetical protein [Absidia glauca]
MRPLNDSLNRDILMDGNQGAFKRPGYHRQNSVISRFDSLRRLYSENSYYDPYQQEQVQQQKQQQGKRKKMDDDDGDDDGSKEVTGDHRKLVNSGEQQHQDSGRPAKRRKSFTSMVKSGVIQGVLFGSALALTAFDYIQVTTTPLKRSTSSLFYSTETLAGSPMDENNNNSWFAGRSLPTTTTSKNMRGHGVDFISYFQLSPNFEKRMQKAEHLIRNICLDQQYALTQHFAPPPTPSRATQEDRCWGLINKDDYDVNFTVIQSMIIGVSMY